MNKKNRDKLDWLTTMLSSLADTDFYGEVKVKIQAGAIVIAEVSQTHKPPESKDFKDMTLAEYRQYQEKKHG